jgi:hypothetical protein
VFAWRRESKDAGLPFRLLTFKRPALHNLGTCWYTLRKDNSSGAEARSIRRSDRSEDKSCDPRCQTHFFRHALETEDTGLKAVTG